MAEYAPDIEGLASEQLLFIVLSTVALAKSELVDAQAGLGIAAETLLMMQAGSNLNHNAGHLDFGLTGSLESLVITDEVIASVVPGGRYLDQRDTRQHLRTRALRASS